MGCVWIPHAHARRQSRQVPRLRGGGHRPDRHPGRLPAGLPSAATGPRSRTSSPRSRRPTARPSGSGSWIAAPRTAWRGCARPRRGVATPTGRRRELEKALLAKPWAQVRERVDVKRLRRARQPIAGPGPTGQCRNLPLRHQPQEAAPRASPRGPLPVALQPLRRRPRSPADVLHRAHRSRAGVQGAQKRPLNSTCSHRRDDRIEAHIVVACLAYGLQVTLKRRRRALAPGLRPRAARPMLDVHLPTTEGRTPILSRYTEPQPDRQRSRQQLHWQVPAQPPPRITSNLTAKRACADPVVPTFSSHNGESVAYRVFAAEWPKSG